MVKPLFFGLGLAAAAGVVYFCLNYEVQSHYQNGRLAYVKIVAKGAAGPRTAEAAVANDNPSFPSTFRIATYNLGRFDDAKQSNHFVGDVLATLLPRFDLIAVQGVRGRNQGVLVRLVEQLNAGGGRAFDFATCPSQQQNGIEHYNAFLFDRNRLDIDRTTVHFIDDTQNRFRIKPLVGAFRARGPDPGQAFTFTLINVATDPDNAAAEVDVLADVYRAVRAYRGGEDDIILLGDLEVDDAHLGRLGRIMGVGPLLSGMPTTVRGTQRLDNIVLDRRATSEFVGRVEVVDMLREFNINMAEAHEISEHLPVWAEFSVYEGGQPGHAVAPAPAAAQ